MLRFTVFLANHKVDFHSMITNSIPAISSTTKPERIENVSVEKIDILEIKKSGKSGNIVIFNWRDILNPKAGGAEKYCFEIARRLTIDGYNVLWIASRERGQTRNDVYQGVKILRVGNIYTVFLLSFFASIGLKDIKATITSINSIPFLSSPKLRKNRHVIIHHMVPYHVLQQKLNILAPIAYFLQNVFNPLFYRKSKILTVSNSTLSDLRNYGYKDSKVVKLGVDVFDYNPRKKKNIILAPGPLRPWKNHSDILKAFASIKSDFILKIFGMPESPSYESYLMGLAEKLGIRNGVEFLGKISDDDKYAVFAESSFVVIASEKEGWGIVSMEAQAMGCPVVAYDVPGIRDSIRNNETGILVKYGDVSGLSMAMRELITNREKVEKMANSAFQHSKDFDWESSYRDFLLKSQIE